MNKKYAIFAAATENYLNHVNAQLNSIEKRKLYEKCDLTYFLMYHDNFPKQYLEDIEDAYSFNVVPVEVVRGDINLPNTTKRIEYIKRCRYKKMVPLALEFDVTCFLDIDMFFVSDQFINLMDMVNGTFNMIGCNEKFKWDIGNNYFYNQPRKPLLDKPAKLMQFICNTPAIFNMSKWMEVFEAYEDIAINGRQYKNGNRDNICRIGDIHCWNIAIQQQRRNQDVIVFPMETMAQVHYTNMRNWTCPIVEQDYWRTQAGDRIYIIHGRVASWSSDGFIAKFRHLKTGEKDKEKMFTKYVQLLKLVPGTKKEEENILKGLKAIQREWYDLNFNYNIKLDNYIDKQPHWEMFK